MNDVLQCSFRCILSERRGSHRVALCTDATYLWPIALMIRKLNVTYDLLTHGVRGKFVLRAKCGFARK